MLQTPYTLQLTYQDSSRFLVKDPGRYPGVFFLDTWIPGLDTSFSQLAESGPYEVALGGSSSGGGHPPPNGGGFGKGNSSGVVWFRKILHPEFLHRDAEHSSIHDQFPLRLTFVVLHPS